MNNQRRKDIKEVISLLNIVKDRVDNIWIDEQTSFDNMPEGLQMSDKGMNSEEAISFLEDAAEYIDNCIDSLNSIN